MDGYRDWRNSGFLSKEFKALEWGSGSAFVWFSGIRVEFMKNEW